MVSDVHGPLTRVEQAISLVEPAALELGTSRGYETPSSKHLMRLSVLFSDVVFLLPAAFLACRIFTAGLPLTSNPACPSALFSP